MEHEELTRIIIGCAIIIAVVLDQASARFARKRLSWPERC